MSDKRWSYEDARRLVSGQAPEGYELVEQDPHAWLDPIIAEQKRLQGGAADLISEMCEAPLPVGEDMDEFERQCERDTLRREERRLIAEAAEHLRKEAKGEGDLDGNV